jgi:uncharacterized protein DUF4242
MDSLPSEELTEQQFYDNFDKLEQAGAAFSANAHAAPVNVPEGKAFCLMQGPDVQSIRKAHEAINFPFDSITEVKRVTAMDLRLPSKQAGGPESE